MQQWQVAHAAQFGLLQAGAAHCGGQLGGPHKALPLVGAARQHAQDVLGADDGEQKALKGAVDGGYKQQPARRDPARHGLYKGGDIADMLDHLKRQHHVEPLVGGQRLGRIAKPVLDRNSVRCGMQSGRRQVAGRSINAHQVGTPPCQRFCQQTTAATHVEDAQARQRRCTSRPKVRGEPVDQVAQSQGIGDVQRPHRPGAVPPGGTEPVEALDLCGEGAHVNGRSVRRLAVGRTTRQG